jgi:hypothetical protein
VVPPDASCGPVCVGDDDTCGEDEASCCACVGIRVGVDEGNCDEGGEKDTVYAADNGRTGDGDRLVEKIDGCKVDVSCGAGVRVSACVGVGVGIDDNSRGDDSSCGVGVVNDDNCEEDASCGVCVGVGVGVDDNN